MEILNKMNALRKKATTREIRGKSFAFYPVRLGKVISGEMRDIITPLTSALSLLMQAKTQDFEILEEVTPDGTVARAHKPISPEMARYRQDKREKNLSEAVNVIFNDETRLALGRLIMDSLRDDCPKKPSDAQITEFIDNEEMDIPTFIEFVRGLLAANTSIFGDLGKALREKVESMMTSQLSPKTSDIEETSMDDSSVTPSVVSEPAPGPQLVTDEGEDQMPQEVTED